MKIEKYLLSLTLLCTPSIGASIAAPLSDKSAYTAPAYEAKIDDEPYDNSPLQEIPRFLEPAQYAVINTLRAHDESYQSLLDEN